MFEPLKEAEWCAFPAGEYLSMCFGSYEGTVAQVWLQGGYFRTCLTPERALMHILAPERALSNVFFFFFFFKGVQIKISEYLIHDFYLFFLSC